MRKKKVRGGGGSQNYSIYEVVSGDVDWNLVCM